MSPNSLFSGVVGWPNVTGSLQSVSGTVCHYVSRVRALAQLLVEVWTHPALTRGSREALTGSAAAGIKAAFGYLVVGLASLSARPIHPSLT